MQLYRSEVNKALSDPNYSADLEPVTGGKGTASQSSGDANCEAKLKSIDNQVAAKHQKLWELHHAIYRLRCGD